LNSFVLDSSIALTWCFKDEESAETRRVLDLAITSQIFVPAHWHFEMTNILGLGFAENASRKLISQWQLKEWLVLASLLRTTSGLVTQNQFLL
jgi:hypothetical protein